MAKRWEDPSDSVDKEIGSGLSVELVSKLRESEVAAHAALDSLDAANQDALQAAQAVNRVCEIVEGVLERVGPLVSLVAGGVSSGPVESRNASLDSAGGVLNRLTSMVSRVSGPMAELRGLFPGNP